MDNDLKVENRKEEINHEEEIYKKETENQEDSVDSSEAMDEKRVDVKKGDWFPCTECDVTFPIRVKLSWKVSEASWNQAGDLYLDLKDPIPRAVHRGPASLNLPTLMINGGVFTLTIVPGEAGTRGFEFLSVWPEGVDTENIKIDTQVTLRRGEVEVASFRYQEYSKNDSGGVGYIIMFPKNNIINDNNPVVMNLFDQNREFNLDAEISIIFKDASGDCCDYVPTPSDYVEDMMKILITEETTDVKDICEEKEFKCHRAILCARSETFGYGCLGLLVSSSSSLSALSSI